MRQHELEELMIEVEHLKDQRNSLRYGSSDEELVGQAEITVYIGSGKQKMRQAGM